MKAEVAIPMPDGSARAFVFTPASGSGPCPVILFYMDGPAIRPALFEMGERMAAGGYYVLLPDMFWRLGPYPPLSLREIFASPESMKAFRTTYLGSTDPRKAMADTEVFLDWIARQPEAKAGPAGTTGYCFGGGMSLRAAAAFPDRVAAAASFHGGNLATDDPQSPHLDAAQIKAKVLVAGADEDTSYDAAQNARMAEALAVAGVDADVSIWTGLKHGWVPSDMPVHDPAGAERHWEALFRLFGERLG